MYWARHCIKWGRPLIAVLILTTIAFGSFLFLAEDVWTKETLPFDASLLNVLFGIRSTSLTWVAQLVTTTGAVEFILVAIAVLSLLGWRRHRVDVFTLWITVAGTGLLNQLLKLLFARPRPTLHPALVHELGYSFPSGHSMAALAFYGIMGYLVGRHLRPPWRYSVYGAAALWIVLVGLSRNYLGVHFPSDVMAAYGVTLPWAIGVMYFHHCVAEDTPLGAQIDTQSTNLSRD